MIINYKNKKIQPQYGFTLIELMIVIAVIGILATIALPQYQKYIGKSEAASALASITGLRTNVESYIIENGQFPATSAAIAIPNSTLGTIRFTNAVSAAGGIQFTFSSTGVSSEVVGKTITLSRNAAGNWSCVTTVDASIKPKIC